MATAPLMTPSPAVHRSRARPSCHRRSRLAATPPEFHYHTACMAFACAEPVSSDFSYERVARTVEKAHQRVCTVCKRKRAFIVCSGCRCGPVHNPNLMQRQERASYKSCSRGQRCQKAFHLPCARLLAWQGRAMFSERKMEMGCEQHMNM